jgi:heme oxygenase (mycobilin-producing)
MGMIVAMSRFRVKNQREQDVREAFLNRPRRVDDQTGFLALEVFQDPADSAVFYLVTRWSDVASFRTWHSGPAHHSSHEMMPKGLKLDPAFTEVRILERVETERDAAAWEHFAGDWGALARAHLASSAAVHGVVAAPDGAILATSAAMARLLGSQPGGLNGQPLWKFLAVESADELRSRIEAKIRRPGSRLPLTFLDGGSRRRLLLCNLDVQPNAFALLGEIDSSVESGPAK